MLAPVRALVTGGAGFIGSHLAERLKGLGHEVVVADNLANGGQRVGLLDNLGIPLEKIDVRDPALGELIASFAPEAIFHLAAQIDVRHSVADPIYDNEVNVGGSLRVLEAARLLGARVLFASSGGTIYGEVDAANLPVTEEAHGRPTSPYGIGKRVVEDYLRFYRVTWGTPFVSLALGNVYGPRQDPHGEAGVVAIFAQRLLRGESCVIYGDGGQTRDFVYVGDVVDAFLAGLERGTGETFHIGTATETSVTDLYWAIARTCGSELDPRHEPERAGELRRSALDNAKARRQLGWEPRTSLVDGLRNTVESLRED
jgi:UDP-glucose 4-epimerase